MVEITEVKKESVGYIAQEKLWLSTDAKIVKDGDYRAAQLLSPAGGIIPEKVAARLGLDKGTAKIESIQKVAPEPSAAAAPAPKTIAPETLSERSTRPEAPASKR